MTMIGNLRYIIYRDTDDLNLTGDSVDFEVLYATGAVLFNNYGQVTPALEMLFEYDFEDYTAFSLSPELVYPATDTLDPKFGVPFRLTSDGQEYAAELELSYHFQRLPCSWHYCSASSR